MNDQQPMHVQNACHTCLLRGCCRCCCRCCHVQMHTEARCNSGASGHLSSRGVVCSSC
jgi:hypothetical protein